jgi:acyl-CoA reductase-like NAD-dependent aldehyde dehydrogenase
MGERDSKRFLGAPFGGFKQSGIGRKGCIEEMFAFTKEQLSLLRRLGTAHLIVTAALQKAR